MMRLMDPPGSGRPPARVPAPADMFALIGIVTIVSAVARAVQGFTLLPPWWSAAAAGVAAAVVGLPLLVYALESRRTGVGAVLIFGALAGVVPIVIFMASGALRLYAFGQWAAVVRVFRHGLPLPLLGLISWSNVARLAAQAIVIGTASALLVRLTILHPVPSAPTRWSAAALILVLVAIGIWGIG